MVRDPDFMALPAARQRALAAEADPEVGQSPPEAQDRLLTGLAADPYDFAERRYGLPKGLLKAIQQQESGGEADPTQAKSPTGVRGIMQITGATARQFGLPPELHM